MSDFKGLDQMSLPFEGPPDWKEEWGREAVGNNARILDQTFGYSRDMPLERRNQLLRVMKEEICPLYSRWVDAIRGETDDITAACESYHKAETGVFHVILRDYDNYVKTLPDRHPDMYQDLMTLIDDNKMYFPALMRYGPGKVIASVDKDKPTISLQYGNKIRGDHLVVKTYKIMCGRLYKKATLHKQQTQILARALEENGIQLPPELADVERQLDDLHQPGPEWPTQQPGLEWLTQQPAFKEAKQQAGPEWEEDDQRYSVPEEKMKRQDVEPRARPFAVIQVDPDRPEFTGMYVNEAPPSFITYKRNMLPSHCRELLDILKTYQFSQSFLGPPTEEEAPGYFDVVREHRDFSTIQQSIDIVEYCPRGFFQDLRLMIDNNCYFFGEGSIQYRRALRLEKKLLKRLPHWGKAGRNGIEMFKQALGAEFNDTYEIPDDNDSKSIPEDDGLLQQADVAYDNDYTFGADEETSFAHNVSEQWASDYGDHNDRNFDARDEETSFAQNLNEQWESDYGDGNDRNFDARDEILDIESGDSYEGSPANESTILRGPSSPSAGEDNTINRAFHAAETARRYDRDVGNATQAPIRYDTQQPGPSFSARPPSPRLGDNEPGEQPVPSPRPDDHEPGEQPVPSPRPDDHEPGEQPVEDFSFFDQHNYPNPDSTVFAPASEGAAGEADEADEAGAHANAHAPHPPAPIAPMGAEELVIDLTSLPQGKRSRDSDDHESLDDDAPLAKRHKSAGKRPAAAVATSSRKRSRSDGDSDGDYVEDDEDYRGSSDDDAPLVKRRKSAGKRPAAAVATSSRKRSRNDDGVDGDGGDEREQPSQRQGGPSLPAQAPLPQHLLQDEAWADLPPSPVPEPLTPVAADDDGHRSVSPPAPEPATSALGHTDQGTIYATQLHKLPKWKKNGKTKGRSIANRPWVFGFGFGEDYGLYVMSCPTKGCPKAGVDTLPDVFRFHPLKCNDSDLHLQACHGDLGDGSDEHKVRKFCKQVISDDKKAVSIEWARKWNEDLIEEYGMPDDRDLRSHNF